MNTVEQELPVNLFDNNTEVIKPASVLIPPVKNRIPDSCSGIQYNFCKNPKCINYGVPPLEDKQSRIGIYTLVGGGKGLPLLKCVACGETPPLKSNKGIVEEIERLSVYLTPKTHSCPSSDCENHTVPLGTKKAYRSFGLTKSGSSRYQCAKCKSTFSIPNPTNWQHETSDNINIFKMLVNKVPLSRIVSMLDIEWQTLYRRIDFIHRQCMAFVANREQKLKNLPIEKLYISIDKQDHLVNWSDRKDKRNVMLAAMTSSDNLTGYVFGMHSNFDYLLNRENIEREASFNGDNFQNPSNRQFARLWLEVDYIASTQKIKKRYSSNGSNMNDFIQATYNSLNSRDDIDNFDIKNTAQKLPDYGMQIHAEYTMIAHFYFLKKLMGNVDKWRFFMDQESGIRSACLSAFQPEIATHKAEVFYVRINKETTQEDKMQFLNLAKKEFKRVKDTYPVGVSNKTVELDMLKTEILRMKEIGHWKDRWAKHPLPMMSEPEKSMCWLTEHEEFDETHIAWLYNKASMHSVDSYFNKVRRRIAMCERPMHSAGNNGRTWSAYQAYKPEVLVKLLEIFRVVHNYIDPREEKTTEIGANGKPKKILTTPAVKLGLANAILDYDDILYYK